MNPELKKCDAVYRTIEDHVFPSREFIARIESFNEDELDTYRDVREHAMNQYDECVNEVLRVLPRLTPAEICQAYHEGCMLLQRNVSGWMGHHFDPVYIPTMIAAIQQHHDHTSWIFIQVLAAHGGSQYRDLIVHALHSASLEVQEQALNLVEQLRLPEAIPQLNAIAHGHTEVALDAQRVLKKLL